MMIYISGNKKRNFLNIHVALEMKAEFNICTYEPEGAGCGYGWWIEASFWERSIRVNSCQVLASFLANSQSWFHMASSPIFPSWCWQMPGLMLGNCGKGATLWLMPKTLSLQVKLSENFVSPSCCFYLPSQTSTYGHMIFKFFVVLCDFVFFFFYIKVCLMFILKCVLSLEWPCSDTIFSPLHIH